jgi:hypothetical protein
MRPNSQDISHIHNSSNYSVHAYILHDKYSYDKYSSTEEKLSSNRHNFNFFLQNEYSMVFLYDLATYYLTYYLSSF